MQTVNAKVILEDAQRGIGWDLEQLETRQKMMTRQAFSLALQEVWEGWWWEEMMEAAQFNDTPTYDNTAPYLAGVVVYFPATKKYYQTVPGTDGYNPPAILGADGSYTTNFAVWAEAVPEPMAGDYDPKKTDYKVGDQVRWLDDGLIYQAYASLDVMKVSGAGATQANGLYRLLDTWITKPAYQNDVTLLQIFWSDLTPFGVGFCWVIGGISGPLYISQDDTPTPDLATGWYGVDGMIVPTNANDPVPTVTASNAVLPLPNELSWGLVNPFTPTISPPGQVRQVAKHDPRNSNNSALVPFERILGGYRLPGWNEGVPWAWYRRAVPIIEGDDYDETVSYTATPAGQLAFP